MGDAEEDLEGDFKDRREPEIRRGRRKSMAKMVFLVISRRLEIVVILIAILVDN